MTSGKDLKEWRKRNHITQQYLSKKTGYSVSRISHIESGDEPLSKRLKTAIHDLHTELCPKDDSVIEAWRNLKSYGYVPVKDEVNSLATFLPDLLSPKGVGDIDSATAYMEFLSDAAANLLKIKYAKGSIEKESLKNELSPIVTNIYKAAAKYLKKKVI